ncbi:fibronectin type III domain-containing protein [Candidatus Parcubacteria bacterium]|nr:fibronectin type III domain-containing protein [Candidatus Parcubacteria bacterium]
MQYQKAIAAAIFLLLILAITLTAWFATWPETTPVRVEIGNKIHPTVYQQAVGYWDANLATQAFAVDPTIGIRLTWKKPDEIYNHFLMTVTDPSTGWTRTEAGEHERVSLDFTDLQPDTVYTFVVTACLEPECRTWITSSEEAKHRTQTASTPR